MAALDEESRNYQITASLMVPSSVFKTELNCTLASFFILLYSFFSSVYLFIYFTLQYCIGFAIH